MTTHRVTITQLRRLAGAIATETGQNLVIDPGSNVYGQLWKLCRENPTTGAQTVILSAENARLLYDQMHAYLAGFTAAQPQEATP